MGHRKQTWLAAILIALLVITVSTGAVFAYLYATSDPVTNDFTPDQATNPSIQETFNNKIKENVSVDVGDPGYAVYVRAVIVVTWQDDAGNVYSVKPVEGDDYVLERDTANWFQKDGFYYHKAMVNSGDNTEILIKECYQKAEAPDGYKLHVEIIAQTIQALGGTDADGTPAVTDAWGVEVGVDGLLTNT